MSDTHLLEFEEKLNALINECKRLQHENRRLEHEKQQYELEFAIFKDQEKEWSEERARLIEKNNLARDHIEKMITKLKEQYNRTKWLILVKYFQVWQKIHRAVAIATL